MGETLEKIAWSDDLSVGIPEIDKQHKILIEMINELIISYHTENEKSAMSEILQKLIDYAVYHFGTEEDYAEKMNAHGLFAHQQSHNAFTYKILDYKNKFDSGNEAFSYELIEYLKEWLINHISHDDKALLGNTDM